MSGGQARDTASALPLGGGVFGEELVAGKYRPLSLLGQGGMADVFAALAKGPAGVNKLVVLKRLRMGFELDPLLLEMFFDEARVAARLTHSNIVQTYEVVESRGLPCIAMEYIEGLSLEAVAQRLRILQAPVPPAVWAYLVAEALRGLHYAHELCDFDGTPLNVIHRDVSPHNILVTYDGDVKLVDFGIAKAATSTVHTEAGTLKGKIGYMPMEQAAGQPVDRRADVFAMGVVLWELLAGRRMFQGSTAVAFRQLMAGVVQPLSSVRPDVPPSLAAVVDKAIAPAAEDRYQTAAAMHEALEGFLHEGSRMVTRRDLALLMATHFAPQREQSQRALRDFLSDGSGLSSLAPFSSGQDPSQSTTRATATTALGPHESAKRPLPGLAIAIASVLATGFVLMLHYRGGSAPGPAAAAPVPEVPTASAAVAIVDHDAATEVAAAVAPVPSVRPEARPAPSKEKRVVGAAPAPSQTPRPKLDVDPWQ